MTINYENEKLALRLWFLTHQTRNVVRRCEDLIFPEYNLTAEQYAVLSAIKYLDAPVRVTDIARWLEHSTNSVSMIVDRMVKAGLLRRIRDLGDRRAVRVVIISKGENALKPAILAGLKFIQEILSPLSYEDRRTFVTLQEVVKYKALEYLNPGVDIEERKRNDITSQANLMERLLQYTSTSTPEAKRQGGKKGKTMR
jgi:DNA-binding MarR family transcriptional regulator